MRPALALPPPLLMCLSMIVIRRVVRYLYGVPVRHHASGPISSHTDDLVRAFPAFRLGLSTMGDVVNTTENHEGGHDMLVAEEEK